VSASLAYSFHRLGRVAGRRGQAVKLPHNDRINLARKDGGLQFLKSITLSGRRALAVFKPLRPSDALTLQPGFQFGALTVGLLAFGERHADVNAGAYAK